MHKSIIILTILLSSQAWAQGVNLTWRSNSESDIAGYKVYWGQASRFYSAMLDVDMDTTFTLTDLPRNGKTYIAVTAYDITHNESYYSIELILENAQFHQQFMLDGGYPNPTNPSATFPFHLSSRSKVFIAIYDILGRRVEILTDTEFDAGSHSVHWDGRDYNGQNVASGTYFCRMIVGCLSMTRKVVVVE